jgi:hypothetical protein
MATLSITVPDALVPRVAEALKTAYAHVDVDGLNDGQAARKIIISIIRRCLIDHESALYWETATPAAQSAAADVATEAEVQADTIS